MKRLVVNADDFGLTESVNRGILESHRNGILTSTTLMANGVAFDSAVRAAADHPELSVGVHLNLTEGCPVSGPSAVPRLVDRAGNLFGGPAGLLVRVLQGRVQASDLERELSAQIEKVKQAGIAITHLDGHKHVHMLPVVFPIVLRLARFYGIRSVRWAVERAGFLGLMLRRRPQAAAAILKQYVRARTMTPLAVAQSWARRRSGITFPMYFYGVTQTGYLDAEILRAILLDVPEGTSELMCHPGYVDDSLQRTRTRLLAQRETELEALTRPELRDLARQMGIQLTGYRELG